MESAQFLGANVIARFSAYVRKPVGVNDGGNKAMFYAESGNNANIVCQFSTNYYWGQTCNINVYFVKNRVGELMNTETGSFPLIASFVARIEHPTHKNTDGGQTAVFYAEAGENGDAVSLFMSDKYVDALVYVELRGMLSIDSPDIFEEASQNEINANHAFNLSEGQRKEYEKNKKQYQSLNAIFKEQILSSNEIIKIIEREASDGRYISFEDYLRDVYLSDRTTLKGIDNHCYFSQRCNNEVHIENLYRPLNNSNPYNIYCLCDEHRYAVDNKDEATCTILEAKALLNKRRWLWHYFVSQFAISLDHEPDSRELYYWMNDMGLLHLLSKQFVKGIQKLSKI